MCWKFTIVMWLAVLVLGGCSTHAPTRVDCDKHLRPINLPAPATAAEASHP